MLLINEEEHVASQKLTRYYRRMLEEELDKFRRATEVLKRSLEALGLQDFMMLLGGERSLTAAEIEFLAAGESNTVAVESN